MYPTQAVAPSQLRRGRVTSRAMETAEMLFMLILCSKGRGNVWAGTLRNVFGVWRASVSNIFYHVAGSLPSYFKILRPALIE